ncbi:MAG: GNAT family N-acetyltransferase, partial [Firmicutes bacterium]|nr:GNAT family N-acetyltransferase [Bacillota bacterium]
YELLSPELAYIYRVAVDPTAPGFGIGSDLISHCLEQIKKIGCKAAALHTNSRYFKLARYYYGKGFFVHSTDNSKGYIRALFVNQFSTDYDADVTPALNR